MTFLILCIITFIVTPYCVQNINLMPHCVLNIERHFLLYKSYKKKYFFYSNIVVFSTVEIILYVEVLSHRLWLFFSIHVVVICMHIYFLLYVLAITHLCQVIHYWNTDPLGTYLYPTVLVHHGNVLFFIQISFHGIPLTHSGSHSIAEIGVLQPCKKVMNIFWTFLKPMKVNENNFHELMSSTNNFFDLLFL